MNWFYFLYLGTLGWGFSFLIIKTLLASLTPAELVFYRLCLGSLFLISLIKIKKIPILSYRSLAVDGFVVGFFNLALPFTLTAYAQRFVPSAYSAIINSLTPLFTLAIGILFFTPHQKLSFLRLLGILLGFFGVVIIEYDLKTAAPLSYGLILLLAIVCYGIAANYIRYKAATKQPLLLAAAATFCGALQLSVYQFAILHQPPTHLPQSMQQLGILLWLGLMASGLNWYLYYGLLQKWNPAVVTMVVYLMVVTGVIASTVFLHEVLTLPMVVGSSLIFLSLLFNFHGHYLTRYIRPVEAKV